ncbi:unnamed protein product [Ectocarpus sp. CCAP 1310/34]|nr:unnamed protein product [Ectocarpus sp. CCAP 1310/34]
MFRIQSVIFPELPFAFSPRLDTRHVSSARGLSAFPSSLLRLSGADSPLHADQLSFCLLSGLRHANSFGLAIYMMLAVSAAAAL